MDNDLIKILQYFNLTGAEAKVYLANLELGKATAYQVADVAQIKRPTAYVIVESLMQKGLITTLHERGRRICLPISPQQLIAMWKGRVESLEAIGPDLNRYFHKSGG